MKRSSLALSLLLLGRLGCAADQPAVGAKAPAFSLPSQEGSTVSLDQNKGKWVVLYFYP